MSHVDWQHGSASDEPQGSAAVQELSTIDRASPICSLDDDLEDVIAVVDKPGRLYVARRADGLIKVGFTTKPPAFRIRQLDGNYTLLDCRPAIFREELRLHTKLRAFRTILRRYASAHEYYDNSPEFAAALLEHANLLVEAR